MLTSVSPTAKQWTGKSSFPKYERAMRTSRTPCASETEKLVRYGRGNRRWTASSSAGPIGDGIGRAPDHDPSRPVKKRRARISGHATALAGPPTAPEELLRKTALIPDT